jgi:two-component system nitrate/nitrite response regulator NarL
MTAVFLVARTRFYREGLADALHREPLIRVVGAAGDPVAALDDVGQSGPDIVLLDTSLAGMPRLIGAFRAAAPAASVVALAIPERVPDVIACVEAGAAGYVTETSSLADLTQTVLAVARGEMTCSPLINAALLRRLAALAAAEREAPWTTLSEREAEVAGLLEEGLSNRQIARRLGIEVATVKNHVHHILGKLQVDGRRAAAAVLRHRVVPWPPGEVAGWESRADA